MQKDVKCICFLLFAVIQRVFVPWSEMLLVVNSLCTETRLTLHVQFLIISLWRHVERGITHLPEKRGNNNILFFIFTIMT